MVKRIVHIVIYNSDFKWFDGLISMVSCVLLVSIVNFGKQDYWFRCSVSNLFLEQLSTFLEGNGIEGQTVDIGFVMSMIIVVDIDYWRVVRLSRLRIVLGLGSQYSKLESISISMVRWLKSVAVDVGLLIGIDCEVRSVIRLTTKKRTMLMVFICEDYWFWVKSLEIIDVIGSQILSFLDVDCYLSTMKAVSKSSFWIEWYRVLVVMSKLESTVEAWFLKLMFQSFGICRLQIVELYLLLMSMILGHCNEKRRTIWMIKMFTIQHSDGFILDIPLHD